MLYGYNYLNYEEGESNTADISSENQVPAQIRRENKITDKEWEVN